MIAEVAAEVTLNCGSGVQTVTPPVFRETGTGWFVDSRGWIITNGHVVQPAHTPPRWLVNQQAQRAVTTACLPKALAARGISVWSGDGRVRASTHLFNDGADVERYLQAVAALTAA